ncbi:unnamed protein product [Calypogeia fissa]
MVDVSSLLEQLDVPRFDGTAFYIWKLRMTTFLAAHSLLGIVNGTLPKPTGPSTGPGSVEEWDQRNNIALFLLTSRIEDSQFSHIMAATTAKDAWDILTKVYQPQDLITQMYLHKQLHAIKMREGDSVIEHIHSFNKLRDELSAAGLEVSDQWAMFMFMGSMPRSYQPFLTFLTMKTVLSLQEVIKQVLQEETFRRLKGQNQEAEHSTTLIARRGAVPKGNNKNVGSKGGSFPRENVGQGIGPLKSGGGIVPSSQFFQEEESSSSNQQNPYKKMKCFYCHLLGHHIKDCHRRIAKEAAVNDHKPNGQAHFPHLDTRLTIP